MSNNNENLTPKTEPTETQQREANHFYMATLRFLSDSIKGLNPKEQPEHLLAIAEVVSMNLSILGQTGSITDEQAEFLVEKLNHALHVFIEERMKELQ
jgi:hypothetical protein